MWSAVHRRRLLDIENYRRGRGLNLEPYEEWVPGPFAISIDDLIAALADVTSGSDPAADERSRARRRFHKYTDNRSTQRLLRTLGIAEAPLAETTESSPSPSSSPDNPSGSPHPPTTSADQR